MKQLLTAAFSTFLSISCNAQSLDEIFEDAGQMYYVDPLLVKAHCIKESDLTIDAYNDKNSDGSIDRGICQINSFWYPKMKEHNITPEMLNNPVVSIYWAAYVINHNFSIGGVNMNSIGAYNAGWKKSKQAVRDKYANEVIAIYNKLKKGG